MPQSTIPVAVGAAGGPNISATGIWNVEPNTMISLAPEDRAELLRMSTVVRFAKGDPLFKSGDSAGAVFNLISGVVKCYRDRHIVGFLFPGDLVGMASNGRYVNSVEAVTAVTAYRISAAPLEARLRRHSALEFQIIAKLCLELWAAQDHALMLSRQHAAARVALFLQMLEAQKAPHEGGTDEIYLPMTRRDIANYLGLAPEVVSRSFRSLAASGAIAFRNHRHVRIIDRSQFRSSVSED